MSKIHSLFESRMVLVTLVAIAVLLPSRLHAQTFYGSLVGTVADTSGAVVPDASVTVTNIGTNEKRSAQTDTAGSFRFVNLVPANYKIEVEKANYKRFIRQPIPVTVDTTAHFDIAMEVGAVSETVEVTTQAPLLQTDSGSLGTLVEGTRVQEMPINGRNTMNLIALAPGVVPQGATSGPTGLNSHSGNTNQQGWGNYQIGGGIAGQGAEYLDGGPINILGGNSMALVPTQDAIQEFSVASNSVTADFGRFGGGVINMTSKSGTNKFHGSAYEYFRNTVLNSNDYFTKQSELQQGAKNKPAQWNQNQYGVNINGPIKRDKAFFLFTWEALKLRTGKPSPTHVPTAGMQDGSQIPEVWTSSKLSNPNVHDPLGKCAITHTAGTASNPGYYTIPFGTNGCAMDSTAAIWKNYYLPPTPGFSDSAGDNYFIAASVADNQNQYNARIDSTLSSKQRIFGRYTYWQINDKPFQQFPANKKYNLSNAAPAITLHQVVLGDTYTINSNTILDVRASYLRFKAYAVPANMNVDQSQFGSAFASLSPQEAAQIFPIPTFSGVHSLYAFNNGFSWISYENYALTGTLTRIVNRHTLKMGGEGRLMNTSALGNSTSGSFGFTGQFTGDEWVDFLLGYTGTGTISTGLWSTTYNYYQGYYLQDTWQVNPKLTINAGIRWELPGGILEKKDKNTVLLPNTVDPYTDVNGTLALVNSPAFDSRSALNERHHYFSPNVGFAYRLGNNMSIRGGYGMSYLALDMGVAMSSSSVINDATTSFTNQGSTPNTSYLLQNAFQNINVGNGVGKITQPAGRSVPGFMTKYVTSTQQSISGNVPSDPYGYVQQWNLSASRQIKGNWMIEASYVGSKATHMPALGGQLNQLSSASATSYTSAQLETSGTIITTPLGVAQKVKYGQSVRPYPFYSGVTDSSSHWGDVHYQALQVRAEKRFRSGGVLMSAYTWSKVIGNADTLTGTLEEKASTSTRTSGIGSLQNYYNHSGERSVLSYNTPQRLVVSYVLNLPFGKNRRWLNSDSGLTGRLASGWAVNGITSLQTGFALGLQESLRNNWSDFGAGTIRPNYTAGCKKDISGPATKRLSKWFDTSCFSAPTVGSTGADASGYLAFGNQSRVDGALLGAGVANWDLSVLKSTRITEQTALQFRAEFFNFFNRVQFDPPVIQDNASGFGGILSQSNKPRLIQFSARVSF